MFTTRKGLIFKPTYYTNMQYPAIYNSAKEAFAAIENGTHKSIAISKKEDFVRLNIDKLTHINGQEVTPIAAYTSGVNCEIEFVYKGETRINFAHIMYSNLTFKD